MAIPQDPSFTPHETEWLEQARPLINNSAGNGIAKAALSQLRHQVETSTENPEGRIRAVVIQRLFNDSTSSTALFNLLIVTPKEYLEDPEIAEITKRKSSLGAILKYCKQSILAEDVLPLLKILAESNLKSFLDNYHHFPTLTTEQATNLFLISAGNDQNLAIINAAQGGHLTTVQALLANGAIDDDHRGQAVIAAAEGNYLTTVQALLANGAIISKYHRGLAVEDAAQRGHSAIVQTLLANGATISDHDRGDAVVAAARGGHSATVQALLANGATISDNDRGQAVTAAARGGHLATLQALLANGGIDDYCRGHAVMAAAQGGYLAIVEALLPKGGDKVELFAQLETLKALHPELAKLPQFIELEEKVKAEKERELELDPIKKDIDQHSGELWRCVGRQSVTLLSGEEGYIYEFIPKPEYLNPDLMTTRLNEIYPAIELDFNGLDSLFGHRLEDSEATREHHNFLNALGYSSTTVNGSNRVTFPDTSTLLDRYNQLRAAHPEKSFPELSIISSLGIAEDLKFVDALIKHHGIISDGKEFIHDHTAHILVILQGALQNPSTFSKTQAEMKEYYQLQLTRITTLEEVLKKETSALFTPEERQDLLKYLPIFKTLLGALVDSISNELSLTRYTLEGILSSYEWESYLRARYSRAAHDAAKEPKPPIFDDAALKRIGELLPLIERIG